MAATDRNLSGKPVLDKVVNNRNCQQCQKEFDDRLDGRLDPARALEFDAHTAGCPACWPAWQVYRGMWEVVSRQPSVVPSFGFAQRTLRRLHEQAERRFWQLPVFRWATAMSLLIVFGVTGVMVYRQAETSQHVATYAAVQHDRLEDFDVIVSLDSLGGETQL